MLLRRIRRALLQSAIGRLSVRRRRLLAWRSMLASDVRALTFARDGMVSSVPELDDIAYYLFVDGGFHTQERRALIEWMRRWRVLSGSRNCGAKLSGKLRASALE